MDLYRFFVLLHLARFCEAGPFVAIAASVAGSVAGEAGVAAVAGSSIAAAVGVGTSAIWYGSFVIVNGALFWGSGLAAAGVLGGAVAGGVGK